MNEHTRIEPRRAPTQGAEGLPRWRWTVADLDRMIEVGLLRDGDHVELIEGEIVPMSPKGNRHDHVKDELANHLTWVTGTELRVSNESGWAPLDSVYCEPDIRVYRRAFQPRPVPAAEILLLVEVADSSLAYDLGAKARLYARLGVHEYWMIEARSLVTHVHRGPMVEGYASVVPVAADAPLTPLRLSQSSISLLDLQIE